MTLAEKKTIVAPAVEVRHPWYRRALAWLIGLMIPSVQDYD
jgi:hypothetical protein